jgi:hypothetical protein
MAFSYPSGIFPFGMTLPSSGIAYVQPFTSASGNLSDPTGAVYPLAVPRIDSDSTEANKYIVPYSAQLFYTALDSIKQEYSARGTSEPTFYAYHDVSGVSKTELTSFSGLLTCPLQNFGMIVDDAKNAISGLVCMSGWNDDFVDYFRRAFDYRILMSGVPSGQRLQDNVSYYNVASGSTVTINPLDRARSGDFPFSSNDVKHLGSQWGVEVDGTRRYGSGVFPSGDAVASSGISRDPEFQQYTFMGHWDWLVQSIMWRPPIVESFTNGTEVAETGYININNANDYGIPNSLLGIGENEALLSDAEGMVPGGSRGVTQLDLGAVSAWPPFASAATSKIGQGGFPEYTSFYNQYFPSDKGKTTPRTADIGDYGQVWIGKPICRSFTSSPGWNSADAGISAMGMGQFQMVSEITLAATASGLEVGLSSNHYAWERNSYDFVSSTQNRWELGGNTGKVDSGDTQTPGDPNSLDDHLAETSISFVSPELSGRWGNNSQISVMTGRTPTWANTTDGPFGTPETLNDRDPIVYPLGSGSAMVVDILMDTHPTVTGSLGWDTSVIGESDPNGVFLSVTTDRHVPTIFYNLDHNSTDSTPSPSGSGRYLGSTISNAHITKWGNQTINQENSGDWGFTRISFDSVSGIVDNEVLNNPVVVNPYKNTPFLELRYLNRNEVNGAFDASGSLVDTSVVTYFETPTIVNAYYSANNGAGPSKAYNSQVSWNGRWIPEVFCSLQADPLPPHRDGAKPSPMTDDARNAIPSGINFTQYKLDNYAPASGTQYEIPLWEKMKTEMDHTASVWSSMKTSRWDPVSLAKADIGQNWKNAFRGAAGASPGATPSFGIDDDEDWFSIQAVSFNQVATLNGAHLSDLGYTIKSFRYKFPVILSPSGVL